MAQRQHREYDDIPGTYVFDKERARLGYALNMFCMSLSYPENREAFKADEEAYLDKWALTPEQRSAVLERRWLDIVKLGGNIYYVFKIAATDGLTFQHLAAYQTGATLEEHRQMMLDGGRKPNG
jgi:protocatechuate 4,5-dioxygenase alpha chain